MLGAPQLASCQQAPTPLDPIHDASQQAFPHMSRNSLWLQQDTQQPTVLLTSHTGVQQTASVHDWGLPVQGLQPFAGLEAQFNSAGLASAGYADFGVGGILQQGNAPATNTVPIVLQVQGPTVLQGPGQQAQQVYLLPSGAQVLCTIDGSQVSLGQQQVVSCVPAPGCSASGLEGQLQQLQLQGPEQHLVHDDAPQGWLVTSAPGAQTQVLQAPPGTFMVEGTKSPTSPPLGCPPCTPVRSVPWKACCSHKPGQLCTCSMMCSSPGGSISRRDSSSSSSWHGLDSLCSSSASSPSFRMQQRRCGGPLSAAANNRPCSTCSTLRVTGRADGSLADADLMCAAGAMPHAAAPATCDPSLPASSRGVVVLSQPPAPGLTCVSAGGAVCRGGAYDCAGLAAGCLDRQGLLVLGSMVENPSAMAPAHAIRQHCGDNTTFGSRPARIYKAAGAPHGRSGNSAAACGSVQPPGARQASKETPAASPAAPAKPGDAAAPQASSTVLVAGPWTEMSLEEGLKKLWNGEQLQRAQGGHLFNVQQLAWHPLGEPDPCAQDLYNFQKLKRVIQKLDAVHKTRVKLIKRIHAVADHGESDLKAVYREVRGLIGEMLRDSAMQIKSLDECRVTGLVRLALMLQHALEQGPKEAVAVPAGV